MRASSIWLSLNDPMGLLKDCDSALCKSKSPCNLYIMLLEIIIPTLPTLNPGVLHWNSLLSTHFLFLIFGYFLAELKRALNRGNNEQFNHDLPPLIGGRLPCMCFSTAAAEVC